MGTAIITVAPAFAGRLVTYPNSQRLTQRQAALLGDRRARA
ncbi:hypothetical protein [Actinacidiphila yanglinensis]|nr:hypothetical protein [Actinacidiphila yanglinensis]